MGYLKQSSFTYCFCAPCINFAGMQAYDFEILTPAIDQLLTKAIAILKEFSKSDE